MDFAVKLIRTRPLTDLTGWDVFDLMRNATHVAGRFWLFEGDEEALLASVEVVAQGVTGPTGDLEGRELLEHCIEIFDAPYLRDEPLSHLMRPEDDR